MSERLDKFREEYSSNEFLDIYKFFTKDQLELIEKLGSKIENRKYSVYDFDVIKMELLKFYKEPNELKERNIIQEEYISVLDVFSKISQDYNL